MLLVVQGLVFLPNLFLWVCGNPMRHMKDSEGLFHQTLALEFHYSLVRMIKELIFILLIGPIWWPPNRII